MKIYTNEDSRLYKVRDITHLRQLLTFGQSEYGKKAAFQVKSEKGGPYWDISYSQFKEDVYALGTYMMSLGLKGEKIAIIGDNCYQWLVAYFATICGIGVVVPLDKELTSREVKNLVDTANCKAIFVTDKYMDKIHEVNLDHVFKMDAYQIEDNTYVPDHIMNMIAQGRLKLDRGDKSYESLEQDPDGLGVILFTSGTTGNPKGVMLSQRNICSVLVSTSKIVKLKEDEKALSILPIHHTFESTMGLMTPLFQGSTIAFCEGLKYVLKNMEEAKATILVAVPMVVESMYTKIWKQAEKTNKAGALRGAMKANKVLKSIGINVHKKLFKSVYKAFGGNLRTIICGAAALNPNTVRGFLGLGLNVSQGYGLTETAPLAAGVPDYEMATAAVKAGSCGPVVPGGQLAIFEPNEDGIGEIIYKGPNVMLGYYNMPEETAKVIVDGWFHTGDLGFVDEMGWLYITGRKKNVIVTKSGKNIYPEELEILINRIPIVKESLVYGLEEEDSNETIVAVQVMLDPEEIPEGLEQDQIGALLKEEIYKLNKDLPSYKRVRNTIIRTEEFIKTTTKKIRREENI